MKKNEEILRYLMTLIKEGKIKEGEKFPSEAMLINKFKFSKQPIREAFKKMSKLGLCYSKQGEGYFLGQKIKKNLLFGFGEIFTNTHSTYEYSGIVSANEVFVYDKELLLEHDKYRKLIIKRYRDDNKLFIYEESFIPIDLTPNFDIKIINQIGLFKYFEQIENHTILFSQKTVRSPFKECLELVNKEFNLENKFFILDIGRVYTNQGVLLEYCLNFYELEKFSWNFIEFRNNL